MNRDLRILETLLSNYSVATLLCDDQESKVRFISKMLAVNQPQNKVIIYIDIDTMFTVFLEDHMDLPYAEYLHLFRPEVEELDDVIAEICSLNPPRIDTVIFDSVTSFYNLQRDGTDSSKVNRKLGLHLALLKIATSRSGGRIMFTSMRRARKKKGEESWYHTHAGGKLLRRRSDLILELKKSIVNLEVSILKCPDLALNGVNLNLDADYV